MGYRPVGSHVEVDGLARAYDEREGPWRLGGSRTARRL